MIELCLADHLFSQSKLSSLYNYYYKEHESKVLTTDVRTLRCATEHMYSKKPLCYTTFVAIFFLRSRCESAHT